MIDQKKTTVIMSSRALKKLYGKSDLDILSSKLDEEEDDVEDEEGDDKGLMATQGAKKKKKDKKKAKGFSFADVGDVLSPVEGMKEKRSDEERDEDLEPTDKNEDEKDEETTVIRSKPTGAKKKKKKNKKAREITEPETKESDENIDDVIKEVCGTDSKEIAGAGFPISDLSVRSLLHIDHRNLNPDNEMKKIFGSKVVAAEQKKARRRGNQLASSYFKLVAVKPEWPPVKGTGLTMDFDGTSPTGNSSFIFRHHTHYQSVQKQFWAAVDSLHPENVMELVRRHPYHVDSLIQLSEMCRIQEDSAMAAELIQRSLYSVEAAFHSNFSLTSGKCRLSYKYRENRGFFLALFYHIGYVSKKGCHRTALEFCKLLYSLDPDADPFACLLLIDFLSLRSSEFDFLLRFYRELEPAKNLSQLPNFAFSVALAQFHLEVEKSPISPTTPQADELLQSALLHFPTVLHHILDKCSVAPDPRVEKHPHFSLTKEYSLPDPLNQLVNLYASRSFHCWKDPDVLMWLERNSRTFMDRFDSGEVTPPQLKEIAAKQKLRFVKSPRNVSRHVVVSDIKESLAYLPKDLKNESINTTDPLPPHDGVDAYEKPASHGRGPTNSHYGEGGIISTFLRSLMPDFELLSVPEPREGVPGFPEPQPRAPRGRGRRNEAVPAPAEAGVAGDDYETQLAAAVAEADLLQEAVAGGAVGGVQVGGGAELRLGVNNLLDALRNLLTNLQPVANMEGGQEGEIDEEDEWSDVEDETDDNDHVD